MSIADNVDRYAAIIKRLRSDMPNFVALLELHAPVQGIAANGRRYVVCAGCDAHGARPTWPCRTAQMALDLDGPTDPWRCSRCGSSRWVAASLTGPVAYGGRAIRQCVPCGHYSNDPVPKDDGK